MRCRCGCSFRIDVVLMVVLWRCRCQSAFWARCSCRARCLSIQSIPFNPNMVPAVGAGVRWFFPVQDDITDVFLSWKTSLFSAPLEAWPLGNGIAATSFSNSESDISTLFKQTGSLWGPNSLNGIGMEATSKLDRGRPSFRLELVLRRFVVRRICHICPFRVMEIDFKCS